MAEKVAGKKEDQSQQSKKRGNKEKQQQQKKKKYEFVQWLVSPMAGMKKKKKKKNGNNVNENITQNENSKPKNNLSKSNNFDNSSNKKIKGKNWNKNHGKKNSMRNVNKPAGGICRSIFKLAFFAACFILTVLGFLYIVDIKKYRSVMQEGGKALYGVREYLPLGVVTQADKVYFHYVRPTVEIAVDKVLVLVKQTSTVLNTNLALKHHWSNINEISVLIGEQLAEYMRTVYNQIPIYYDYAKNKLF